MLILAVIVAAALLVIAANWRPAERSPQHPGLLFQPHEIRDAATRLAEYDRRRNWVAARVRDWHTTGSVYYDDLEGQDYFWWLRARTAHDQFLIRSMDGIAVKQRYSHSMAGFNSSGRRRLRAISSTTHAK